MFNLLRINRSAKAGYVVQGEKLKLEEKQRLIVFLFSFFIVVIGCVINLAEISGPEGSFFRRLNTAQLLLILASAALLYFHKLSLTLAVSVLILTSLAETSAEMLFCTFRGQPYDLMLIAGNVAILMILVMLPMVAYIRFLSYAIGAISILTYGACAWISKNAALENFFLIYFLIILLVSLLSDLWVRNFKRLESENAHMKKDEQMLLRLFSMDKQQLAGLIELSKDKHFTPRQTEHILDLIGEQARANIMEHVRQYSLHKQTIQETLERYFPELSPSELQICQLILRDKKQGEISRLLAKSASNITCQRHNIRQKLNISKDKDLKEFLTERIVHQK